MSRQTKAPGTDHPITMQRIDRPARILAEGTELVAAENYIALKEADYPEVAYIPRDVFDSARIEPSDHRTWCPYKGEATYFHYRQKGGNLVENALWSYEAPSEWVEAIRGHIAAYPDRVQVIETGEHPDTADAPNTFNRETRPRPLAGDS